MAGFWGVEVRPGESHTYESENEHETLYITQATLGIGSSKERSIVQCTVGERSSPVFLCSLLPDNSETCVLNLVFRDDEVVTFSIIGETSVHLAGYVAIDEEGCGHDDDHGEDIADTESDESSEFDYSDEYDEDDDDFIDDDEEGLDMYPRKSGVVIEEIEDDEEPEKADGDGLEKRKKKKDKKKKDKSADDKENDSGKQIVLKNSASVIESEDEDGFPVPEPETDGHKSTESKKKKRKVNAAEPESEPEKKKKNKKKIQKSKEETNADMDEDEHREPSGDKTAPSIDDSDDDERKVDADAGSAPTKSPPAKKKNKKKNKKANDDGKSPVDSVPVKGGDVKSSLESDGKQSASKHSKERSYPNGLVIEDLALGNPNGKKASLGSQVGVYYIGKLMKNGKIFDSNVRGPPFKFKLGKGEVIQGWDVGVEGMRVGDKRRLTIPPSLGYGHQGSKPAIPPNAWLVFEVEVKNIR